MEYVTKKELQDNYPTKDKVAVVYATKVNLTESEDRQILRTRELIDSALENFRINMERYVGLLIEKLRSDMKKHNDLLAEKFRHDMERYMGSLNEDYQSRLSAVGEGVTGTWEKCERKYIELGEVDKKLDTRVERIESVIVLYDTSGKVKNGEIVGRRIRKHAGKGQINRRKNNMG